MSKHKSNTLLDNSDQFKMDETLCECIAEPTCNIIKIATGYWDMDAIRLLLNPLQAFFKRGGKMQLLIGTDPRVKAEMISRDESYKKEDYPEGYIKYDINHLSVTDDYQATMQLLLDYAKDNSEDSPLQIKIYKKDAAGVAQFFHAKCYIFRSPKYSRGIIGSSNFTQKGLTSNSELNYLETDGARITATIQDGHEGKGHIFWFNEKWDIAEFWTKEFMQIIKDAPIGQALPISETPENVTPHELYIKYLQMKFGDMFDAEVDEILKTYLPKGIYPLQYQIDAVKQCFSTMKVHGGFILGDVVGLGKTIVGALIIKRFIEESQALDRLPRVLIVVPPAIKQAWEGTISKFDQDSKDKIAANIDFITTGSIGKLIDAEIADDMEDDPELDTEGFETSLTTNKKYGLILIDESHNFRNNETKKYKDLNNLIGNNTPTPYIALLSATPQNNTPKDLRNQIYLFQREPNKSTLAGIEGRKLDTFFSQQINKFGEAHALFNSAEAKKSNSETASEAAELIKKGKAIIKDVSQQIRDKVLVDLVVRRTRADLKKTYPADSEQLKFPSVQGPHKLSYEMDETLVELFNDTVNAIYKNNSETFNPTKHIGFYRYAGIMFFKDEENKRLYEKNNLSVKSISARLQTLMRKHLVKRLESSFGAFNTSLHNLLNGTNNMLTMLERDAVFFCPDVNVNKVFKDNGGDFERVALELRRQIRNKGKNNREFKAADFTNDYRERLLEDKRLIELLCKRWDKNDYDPKFDKFKQSLTNDLFDPAINNPHGFDTPRLVIFTEALDTLHLLEGAVNNSGHKALAISAQNRIDKQQLIMENFDANYPKAQQRDDYDVLITTEVLAEGVNLHRANVILNYDTPWNATRLIQRIGRVNRIGSKEDAVHVFNFYPTAQANVHITLIEKAYAKLQSFHIMFGEDNKIFSEEEELMDVDLNKRIDEDLSAESPFIADLRAFKAAYPAHYERIKRIELNETGGQLQHAHSPSSLIAYTDDTHEVVCFIAQEGGDFKTATPLDVMNYLKDNKNTNFVAIDESDKKVFFECSNKYFDEHRVHSISGKEIPKSATEALEVLKQIEREKDFSKDKLPLIKQIGTAIRNKNTDMIRIVLECQRKRNSKDGHLFASNYDLNKWLDLTHNKLASKAQKRYGERKIFFFEYATS